MTQQQLLTGARKILIGMVSDVTRKDLQSFAHATGRPSQSVKKASTMRLALWVSKGTSAI
jgi:hypothetical protein